MSATTKAAPAVQHASQAPHVYVAICEVMGKLAKEGISKERKNTAQGYSFRGIDDVYNKLSHLLAEHRLTMTPRVLQRDHREETHVRGTKLFYVTVEVEYTFTSALDGSQHVVSVFGEAMDSADKATNKAMSAAYKYAALQVFCIPTEGDNDADATTHEIVAVQTGVRPQGSRRPIVSAREVQETLPEGDELARLIDRAVRGASTGWDHKFVREQKQRYDQYGEAMRLTERQREMLVKIADKARPAADDEDPFTFPGVGDEDGVTGYGGRA